ncbi:MULTISPECIES: 5'-nucleotidase [Mycobacteriaceae]|uniref:5'-nucleotidase n=1 Tax=Mycobacteriaceae TaxID=1762 RepID=UPI000465C134|nr:MULTISPECIES: 5'-nucleotidase [Mycobacteriaceae]SHV78491.1 5'-nucleotidase [Mycobacteroides abscessus subsp. abscessus]SHX15726.1 5'-nucleotidase [Mycobacteroides abscessus subsp. abscessus]SIB17664.1 5'-nucleotidase [Mycobacteroides abscessus subsp. abscessus]SKV43538.1 5'-nucleotidase [Mycobacteroides abscessus subsp. abscessus]GJJ21620.1 5'-nucleotidase [Mycolicibacterium mageritense]
MPYELSDKLVVGVASSALFDLTESDAYFREHGEDKYRTYQDERIDQTLVPGVAFPFIRRLLNLNDLRPGNPLVEVIILSHNDPMTGLRVMRSVRKHGLPITRSVFTQGQAPYGYIEAFEMSLFLTADRDDVDAAIKRDLPAGHVLPSTATYDDADPSLRVAFDFDGVLASDESERVYREADLIEDYLEHEDVKSHVPLAPGLLKPLLADLNRIQTLEDERRAAEPSYVPRLRISLITARNAPAHERAVHSMRDWGVNVNDAFFLGGIEKSRVLEVLGPHIFFDDQQQHLDSALEHIAGVHIPYGVANVQDSADDVVPTADIAFPPLVDPQMVAITEELPDDLESSLPTIAELGAELAADPNPAEGHQ